MKTLRENTRDFVKKVKEKLDKANWTFEGCDPRANYADCYKAVRYLEGQRFSEATIKKELSQIWDDIIFNIRNNNIKSHEDAVNLSAKMVSHNIAWNRVKKYGWTYHNEPHSEKAWYLPESVIFEIR